MAENEEVAETEEADIEKSLESTLRRLDWLKEGLTMVKQLAAAAMEAPVHRFQVPCFSIMSKKFNFG
jgi:hypothetical protein